MSIEENFKKLYDLKEGWLDGYGKAPDKELIDTCIKWAVKYDIPDALVTPNPEGGILLEWESWGHIISLDIHEDYSGYFHSMSIDRKTEIETTLNLRQNVGWKRLKSLLSPLLYILL